MAINDLDMWLRKTVREALEQAALGESYSFMTGPTLAPGTSTPVYLVTVTRPSPLLGQTLQAMGLITIPVDQEELAELVGKLVEQLRASSSAAIGVGFSPASSPR